ncbi:MAG TPA: major capsid protein [Planctomycetota bacterium]|jgi:hypothetical protein
MTIYVPQVQTPYIFQALLEEEKWQSFLASGVPTAQGFDEVWPTRNNLMPGDYVNIPQWKQAAPFGVVDISDTTTDGAFADISTDNIKVPVIRMQSLNKYTRYNEIRAGEDFRGSIEYTIGNRAAQANLTVLGKVLSACADVTSPSHVQDEGGDALTVAMLNTARGKLGDIGLSALTTLMCTMPVALDLFKDLQQNFKYAAPFAQFLIDGQALSVLGLRNLIVTDTLPGGAASSSYGLQYETFLLGEGSVFWAYQREPEIEFFANVPKVVTSYLVKVGMDFVLAPKGFQYSAPGGAVAGSPTLAQLEDPANWAQATENHRNIKFVKILSGGKSGA